MKTIGKVVYIGLAICLVASMLAFGCAKPAPQKAVTLRLVAGLPITHFFTQAMELFKQQVEAGTNGIVKVENYPGKELYGHKDIPRVVPSGAVEMAIPNAAHLGGLNPIGNMAGYYFMIKTADQWYKARDTVVPILDKIYNQNNIKVIVPLYYGHAALGCAKKLLRVPADAKGLKIRGPTRAHLDCIEAWGAIGASLAAGEVYDALGKGAIDGVATGWSSHDKRAHYEVADYFSGPCLFSVWLLVMNLDTWNGLSKDNQKVVLEAANNMEKFTKDRVAAEDEKSIAKLKQSGVTVHFFTPEEWATWTKATKPAYDKWVVSCTEAGAKDEVIKVLKALKIEGY